MKYDLDTKIKALEHVIEHADSTWDEGPLNEGWKSDELIKDIEIVKEILEELKNEQ